MISTHDRAPHLTSARFAPSRCAGAAGRRLSRAQADRTNAEAGGRRIQPRSQEHVRQRGGHSQHALRSTKTPSEFAAGFAGRRQSLARVHALLSGTTEKGRLPHYPFRGRGLFSVQSLRPASSRGHWRRASVRRAISDGTRGHDCPERQIETINTEIATLDSVLSVANKASDLGPRLAICAHHSSTARWPSCNRQHDARTSIPGSPSCSTVCQLSRRRSRSPMGPRGSPGPSWSTATRPAIAPPIGATGVEPMSLIRIQLANHIRASSP